MNINTELGTISCKIHRKLECYKCYDNMIEKTKIFIKKHKEKHINNKVYDYTKTIFLSVYTPITIICCLHGEYTSIPQNIAGCPTCIKSSTSLYNLQKQFDAKSSFKLKANLIHNNKYDYSKVNYITAAIKIEIICHIHGSFFMTPNNHLRKKGCKHCGTLSSSISKLKYTPEIILKKLIERYGTIYDYSNIVFRKLYDIIEVNCKEHGKFKVSLNSHLVNGVICPGCKGLRNFNTESFITYCRELHNNKYDYSLTIYTNIDNKVDIICKEHGKFSQCAYSHAKGIGCRRCSIKTGYSTLQIEWLNFMSIRDNTFIQHMENSNEEHKIINTNFKADGYSKETNTVYEFHGSFYHGSPKLFKQSDINPITKKTFGELYRNTINRENIIRNNGYNLKVIWEEDWNNFKKIIVKLQKKLRKKYKLNKTVYKK